MLSDAAIPVKCGLTVARQANCKLGELALTAVDLDRAAMLLRDVVRAA
jgi:hypothetical protein